MKTIKQKLKEQRIERELLKLKRHKQVKAAKLPLYRKVCGSYGSKTGGQARSHNKGVFLRL